MNEQIINELAHRARAYWNQSDFNMPRSVEFQEEDLYSFAELVVKECIDWCNVHASIDGTAQKIVESIKKDFGIE